MIEPEKLTPVSDHDLADALSYALRFNGRKRVRSGAEFMADITAMHLVDQLRLAGYVIYRQPATDLSRNWNRPPKPEGGRW